MLVITYHLLGLLVNNAHKIIVDYAPIMYARNVITDHSQYHLQMFYLVIIAPLIVKHVLLQVDNVKFVIRDSYYKDKDVYPLNRQIVLKQIQVEDAKCVSMDFTIIMDFAYNV